MSGSAFEPIRVPDQVWRQHEDALIARDVGALFRLAKQYAGASQNRIAAATGVAQSRVNELMNRGGSVASIDVLRRIADGLNLPDEARMCLGLAPRNVGRSQMKEALTAELARSRTMADVGMGDMGMGAETGGQDLAATAGLVYGPSVERPLRPVQQ